MSGAAPVPPAAAFAASDDGPFDIIGDVHGCLDELAELLSGLGYPGAAQSDTRLPAFGAHPEGRRLVFLGDLVDRGPSSAACLHLVRQLCEDGRAMCLLGNHEAKLLKKLQGRNVQVSPELAVTLADILAWSAPGGDVHEITRFLEALPAHAVLDGGALVVSHAALPPAFHGTVSEKATRLALYGQTTGRLDERGLPERVDWMQHYDGAAVLVYGHHEVPELRWQGRSICIDSGCVFGRQLTALRYPELTLLSVASRAVYARK